MIIYDLFLLGFWLSIPLNLDWNCAGEIWEIWDSDDYCCSGNLLVQYTNPNTWLTNDAQIQVRDWLQQLKEDVGCKFLQFIDDEDQEAPWLQNPMAQRRSYFFLREQGTRSLFTCTTAFKIIFIYV